MSPARGCMARLAVGASAVAGDAAEHVGPSRCPSLRPARRHHASASFRSSTPGPGSGLADGLAVAKQYATAHGHFLPDHRAPGGHPIGAWAKNSRAAARRARDNEGLRAACLPVPSAAGAMSQARQEELDAIDPVCHPAWNTGWQRCYRLAQFARPERPAPTTTTFRGVFRPSSPLSRAWRSSVCAGSAIDPSLLSCVTCTWYGGQVSAVW